MLGRVMSEAMQYAEAREQVRGRAVVVDGACTEDALTVLCRLMFYSGS